MQDLDQLYAQEVEEADLSGVEDVEFSREAAESMYLGSFPEIHPERWYRARRDIRFDDVVHDLTGLWGHKISCPFHGTDRKPSFQFYPGGNDAFCFGCPPGKGYYDAVIFVAERLGMTRVQALGWLEKKYSMPPIADLTPEEMDEPPDKPPIRLTFEDLLNPFLDSARADLLLDKSTAKAREYFALLFEAWPTRKQEEIEGANAGNALLLAQALDPKLIDILLKRKQAGV